jgi:hypothetical protein
MFWLCSYFINEEILNQAEHLRFGQDPQSPEKRAGDRAVSAGRYAQQNPER